MFTGEARTRAMPEAFAGSVSPLGSSAFRPPAIRSSGQYVDRVSAGAAQCLGFARDAASEMVSSVGEVNEIVWLKGICGHQCEIAPQSGGIADKFVRESAKLCCFVATMFFCPISEHVLIFKQALSPLWVF